MLFSVVLQEVTRMMVGYSKLTFSENEVFVVTKKKKKTLSKSALFCNTIMCCLNKWLLLSSDCLKISGVILSNSFIPINFAISEKGGDNAGPTDCSASALLF